MVTLALVERDGPAQAFQEGRFRLGVHTVRIAQAHGHLRLGLCRC